MNSAVSQATGAGIVPPRAALQTTTAKGAIPTTGMAAVLEVELVMQAVDVEVIIHVTNVVNQVSLTFYMLYDCSRVLREVS